MKRLEKKHRQIKKQNYYTILFVRTCFIIGFFGWIAFIIWVVKNAS